MGERPSSALGWRAVFCMGAGVYPDVYPGEEPARPEASDGAAAPDDGGEGTTGAPGPSVDNG